MSSTFAKLSVITEAKVWDDAPLYLKEHLASGDTPAGEHFEVDRTLPNGSLLVRFRGQVIEVGTQELVTAVIRAYSEAIT